MANLDRPAYMDFDFTRYFGSLIRLQLDLRLRAVYIELFLKIGESGGSIPNKPAVLATFIGGGCTAADIEQVLTVAGALFVANDDGTIGHRVVSEKLEEIRGRREAAVQAGRASGRARGGRKARTDIEQRSNDVHEPLNGDGKPAHAPLNQEGVSEGLSDKRDLRAGAREQVKPVAQRAPDQNPRSTPRWTPPTTPPPGARPAPVTVPPGMTPEHIERLIDTCLATRHDHRDLQRPWLNRAFGSMYGRLRVTEQIAIEDAFTARYGYGIDTGPQGHRTEPAPTNGTGQRSSWSPDPVSVGTEGIDAEGSDESEVAS